MSYMYRAVGTGQKNHFLRKIGVDKREGADEKCNKNWHKKKS